jgi:hypothetical protein
VPPAAHALIQIPSKSDAKPYPRRVDESRVLMTPLF